MSTGIGGALFINGDLYDGATGSAGEVGHTPISDNGPACGQGHPGCLEGMSSGTAIAARAHAALAAGAASSLRGMDPALIDARVISTCGECRRRTVIALFTDAGHALGRAIGGFINVLAPDAIVIGGSLIHAGDLLLAPARHAVTQIAFAIPASRCKIVTAALGTDAGLIGAVAWAVRSFSGRPVAGALAGSLCGGLAACSVPAAAVRGQHVGSLQQVLVAPDLATCISHIERKQTWAVLQRLAVVEPLSCDARRYVRRRPARMSATIRMATAIARSVHRRAPLRNGEPGACGDRRKGTSRFSDDLDGICSTDEGSAGACAPWLPTPPGACLRRGNVSVFQRYGAPLISGCPLAGRL